MELWLQNASQTDLTATVISLLILAVCCLYVVLASWHDKK